MQSINNITLLLHHMEWADAKVLDSVLKLSSSNSDSKMRKLLYHLHSVQRAFFYLWTKQPLEFPKETDFPDLLDIAKWGYEYYKQLNEYLISLNENELNKIIEIPWASEKTGSMFQFIQSAINITNNFPAVRNSLFVENNLKEITALMLSDLVAEKLKLTSIVKHDTSKLVAVTAQEIIDSECETLFTVQEIANKLNTSVRS